MKHLISILAILFSMSLLSQKELVRVYLIPGQGADYRLFNNLNLGKDCDTVHIKYTVPVKGMNMEAYARMLAEQIDTLEPFVLIGTSLGGMLAVEMNDFLHPEKVIVISSAKCRDELPGRYKFQKAIPIYKLFTGRGMKLGARIMQPIVEPDRKKEKETFKAMLKAKNPKFMKRSIAMIINWEREESGENIIHIHGDNDHTLPIKNVKYEYVISDGSHMMTLTRGAEISELIRRHILPQR